VMLVNKPCLACPSHKPAQPPAALRVDRGV
jgi:hypothetical protein